MNAAPPVVALAGLSVRLGKREILKDLKVSLNGRAIGLLGPNGAGKSTLIRTVLGFCPIAAGTAAVLGHDVARAAHQVKRLVGYMPENDAFIANMTAVSFVRMMGELSGLPAEAALERAHEVLFYVGLGEARYRTLGTYSTGMKQLAKLAQAIVHGPRLVILDEPTNGLDPPARLRMLKLIRQIRDAGDTQVVLCSHLLRDVEESCDEVLILKQGRIVHYSNLAEERRSTQGFVDIETKGNDAAFAEALQAMGCQCATTKAGRFEVILPANLAVRDIYDIAAAHDLQLRHLAYRRDTLESIFLKAMEG